MELSSIGELNLGLSDYHLSKPLITQTTTSYEKPHHIRMLLHTSSGQPAMLPKLYVERPSIEYMTH